MFFFVGGITQKTKRLDDQPLRCPNCGMQKAFRTRADHWLHLFFIPVLPVRRGSEFVFCEACLMPADGGVLRPGPAQGPGRCPSCGAVLEKDFRFCPGCGQRLKG